MKTVKHHIWRYGLNTRLSELPIFYVKQNIKKTLDYPTVDKPFLYPYKEYFYCKYELFLSEEIVVNFAAHYYSQK